jgi:hypothetical protein
MPVHHDQRVRDFGTKVRLFAQPPFLAGFSEPEVVWLSPPAGTLAPGPADDRMYVVDAIDKTDPYEFPYLPPYSGRANPPVRPNPQGHFDDIAVDRREFLPVHLYGSLRRVLDIFESYFGRRVEWQFRGHFDRLEVIPLIEWENAQSGYGFMEFGYSQEQGEETIRPFALNFDVIAHEMGHSILFGTMGLPLDGTSTDEFRAFHESSADLVALLSKMHFDTVLDRLLHSTRGNIYTLNELNRIGELSEERQIRIAANDSKMSDVTREVHDLSRPLTGAIFDSIAFIYLDELYQRGLVGRDLFDVAKAGPEAARRISSIQAAFGAAYSNRHFSFKSALMEARDAVGARLAAAWDGLSPNDLRFSDVATEFLIVNRRMGGERYEAELREIFHWREIYESVGYLRT